MSVPVLGSSPRIKNMSQENHPTGNNTAPQQKQIISQLAQSGDITGARQLCTTLCEEAPNDPEAWFLLGAIHGAVSNFPEAEACCKKAIALAPEQPMLRYNLAVALLRQGKAVDAIPEFELAISMQPDFADAHRELGNAYSLNNEPLRAISSYEKAAELDPGSAATQNNLGSTYLDLDRNDEAIECFQKAVALQPDFVDAYDRLASTLINQFKFDKAIKLLKTATGKLPDTASLFALLALAYQNQGDADEALKYYEKTLSIDPDSISAQVGVAAMMALQGRYDEAGELLETLLAGYPEHPGVKTTYTTLAYKFGAADKAIKIAEREIKNNGTPERTKATYSFALAYLYEMKGELDTAFEHYVSGNRLRNARFDYTSYDRMFRTLMEKYSAENMRALPQSSNASDNVIFIIGMPRSGTSLAEQVLASHPEVYGAGELRNINYMVDSLPQTLGSSSPYPYCLDQLTEAVLDQLADEYLADLKKRSGGTGRYFTNKLPINFIHIGFINRLFPNARFIHTTRDPRDTCLSCFFKLFSGELPYAYSLTDLGKFYRLYQRMMVHWKRVLPVPIYELNYENLVFDQENETRKLIDFCGLDWNDACLHFHKTDRTVATASHDQVRKPIYTSSIGRWRSYEKYLDPLIAALRPDT